MSETPSLTRSNTCPVCGLTTDVPRLYLWGRERFANVAVMCDDCHAEATRQKAEFHAAQAWQRMLVARLPDRYMNAKSADIPAALMPAYRWQGEPSGGIGLIGCANAGKSSALSCLIMRLRWPFLWWSGTEARQAAVDAATSDKDRKGARERWEHGMTIPLLVLDDISQAKFTESWASSLFDLLETRLASNRATLWTSQLNIFNLRNKIAKQSEDDEQAGAISRRLEQHSLVINA